MFFYHKKRIDQGSWQTDYGRKKKTKNQASNGGKYIYIPKRDEISLIKMTD